MKKSIVQTFMAMLLLAGLSISSVQAQMYDDGCFVEPCDPCFQSNDPCSAPPYCDEYLYDFADECCWQPCCDNPSRFYVGPVYFLRRTDFPLEDCTAINIFGIDSNTKVRGHFVGVNFGYEYRELCSFYLRGDATWSTGTQRPCPRHHVSEWEAEGRIGYTWGQCIPQGYAITPYVGVGYFWEDRKFNTFNIRTTYSTWYVPIGVYADVEVMYGFTAGIDFAYAPFFSAQVDVNHHDYDIDNKGGNSRYLWRVSIPLRWQVMEDCGFELSVEPFWEQRHFGRICSVPAVPAAGTTPAILEVPGVPSFREDLWGAKFLAGYKF